MYFLVDLFCPRTQVSCKFHSTAFALAMGLHITMAITHNDSKRYIQTDISTIFWALWRWQGAPLSLLNTSKKVTSQRLNNAHFYNITLHYTFKTGILSIFDKTVP